MLVGCVAEIIAKHKEFIYVLRICEPNHKKHNKFMNARWARNENHSQTQGIHMFTKNMLAKLQEK